MYPGSRWNLKNDQSEQLIPEPGTAIQHIDIDPVGQYMAVVNSKVYILFYITPPTISKIVFTPLCKNFSYLILKYWFLYHFLFNSLFYDQVTS